MKLKTAILFASACSALLSCNREEALEIVNPDAAYFPPTSTGKWDSVSPESLNWNTGEIQPLYDYLESNGTRAFIILQNGRIVVEKYWGTEAVGNRTFSNDSNWYWASASKTIVAVLVGIAQGNGQLDINKSVSAYLGNGWSTLTAQQEDQIKVAHHLQMTTGLDYTVPDLDCVEPACFVYKSSPNQEWHYHNGPYTLLHQVIQATTDQEIGEFSAQNLESIIGMAGGWRPVGGRMMYVGTARDAARFGLLLLNEGDWDNTTVLEDKEYFNQMTNPSQQLNPSYGYLTWLNGEASYIPPQSERTVSSQLVSNAPADLYAALGFNGQFIDVVPSKDMVVIRLGQAPDESLVPIDFPDISHLFDRGEHLI
ncbi:MAG: serine hydrolase domain-containing protein [Tunicatimonas sp.]